MVKTVLLPQSPIAFALNYKGHNGVKHKFKFFENYYNYSISLNTETMPRFLIHYGPTWNQAQKVPKPNKSLWGNNGLMSKWLAWIYPYYLLMQMFKVKWKLSLQKDVSGIIVAVKTNFNAIDRRWSGSLGNKQENKQNILSIFFSVYRFQVRFQVKRGSNFSSRYLGQ